MQYNRARYYDATIGRWISQDPLGFAAGDSNLYRYANNRVTSATDPSGERVAKARLSYYITITKYFYIPEDVADNPKATLSYIRKQSSVGNAAYTDWRLSPFSNDEQQLINDIGNNVAAQKDLAKILTATTLRDENAIKFIKAGVQNHINGDVIAAVMAASENSNPLPIGIDLCLAWVNNFRHNLAKRLGTQDFAPLMGTGLSGRIVTWHVDANFGLTDSHAGFLITFPDQKRFYFDNTALSGKRITLKEQIPEDFTNEK